MKLNFEEPKNRDQAIADFKGLLESAGWKRVEEIAYNNMEEIKNQILLGIGDEDLESIRRLRDRLRIYKDVIETPQNMIKALTPPDPPTHNEDDPFPFVKVEADPKK